MYDCGDGVMAIMIQIRSGGISAEDGLSTVFIMIVIVVVVIVMIVMIAMMMK